MVPVIKITFSDGEITSQELAGLTSYQSKAQTLLESTQDNDFTITEQSQILPSAYNNKVALLNQLKAKANAITNNNAKIKVKAILEIATITFDANDQTGILSFTIAIGKVNNTFTNSSFDRFNSVYQVNKRIDAEVAKKTKPTLNPNPNPRFMTLIDAGRSLNTGNKEDIIFTINSNDKSLKSIIKDISYPYKANYNVVQIEVSSPILGTKKATYSVNVRLLPDDTSNNIFGILIKKISNAHFKKVITNKKNILPSDFNNVNLIKNVYKNNLNLLPAHLKKKSVSINNFKKAIDNFLIISFSPDDRKGILKFKTQLGSNYKSFKVSDFKTSSF